MHVISTCRCSPVQDRPPRDNRGWHRTDGRRQDAGDGAPGGRLACRSRHSGIRTRIVGRLDRVAVPHQGRDDDLAGRPKHGIEELVVNEETVDLTYPQGATVPLNVTGLPGLSMRYGTNRKGLPINVRLVDRWQAESTILHAASLLEGVSPVRDLHPTL